MIDFLQIPNPYRKRLLKHKAKEEGNINKAYSSAGEDSREERDSLQGEKSFCPWFYVEYIEYKREGENSFYEYVFLITCNKGKEKRWTITKRYKEFLGLESGLKEIIKVNLPKLPGKQVFHNEDIIKERCLKLEEFLRVLLNESPYICPILIKFIEYREDPNYKDPLFSKEHVIYNETPLYQDEHIIDEPPFKGESIYKGKEESLWGTFSKDFLLDFPSIKNCYQGLQAREFESQLSFETNEGQFVIYLITIERGKGTFFCKLAKRYSDFEALNQALLIRFGHEIESLPELPGKLDFLEEKGSRGERLMEFLNTLLKKKGVEDCFAFRKFLGIDIKSLVN